MNITEPVEGDILKAIRKLYRESGLERPVLTRTHINREIMENSGHYPNIRPYNLFIRRKQITVFCNTRFKEHSLNWRSGSWVVTAEAIS